MVAPCPSVLSDAEIKALADRADPVAWARFMARYWYLARFAHQQIRHALAQESLTGTQRALMCWGTAEEVYSFAVALRAAAGLPPDVVWVTGASTVMVRGKVWAVALGETEAERAGRAEAIRGALAAALG